MDLHEVKVIAERYLDEHVRPGIGEEVVLTTILEFPGAWVAGHQTRAFWETGAIRHALTGSGPIIVDKASGGARVGTSALPTEDQVDGAGAVRWRASGRP